jgi:hypothetical protein
MAEGRSAGTVSRMEPIKAFYPRSYPPASKCECLLSAKSGHSELALRQLLEKLAPHQFLVQSLTTGGKVLQRVCFAKVVHPKVGLNRRRQVRKGQW